MTLLEKPLRRDAERNRERIVAAAAQAFADDGADVPVEEIARLASVGVGTVYRRFPTKEDLVDAVLERALEQFVSAAEQALQDPDAWAGFRSFLLSAAELHVRNRGIKDVAGEAQGRALTEAKRARLRPLVRKLVARAKEQGALRSDFQAEDMAVVFRLVEALSPSSPQARRRQLGFLLDGLRAGAPAGGAR